MHHARARGVRRVAVRDAAVAVALVAVVGRGRELLHLAGRVLRVGVADRALARLAVGAAVAVAVARTAGRCRSGRTGRAGSRRCPAAPAGRASPRPSPRWPPRSARTRRRRPRCRCATNSHTSPRSRTPLFVVAAHVRGEKSSAGVAGRAVVVDDHPPPCDESRMLPVFVTRYVKVACVADEELAPGAVRALDRRRMQRVERVDGLDDRDVRRRRRRSYAEVVVVDAGRPSSAPLAVATFPKSRRGTTPVSGVRPRLARVERCRCRSCRRDWSVGGKSSAVLPGVPLSSMSVDVASGVGSSR